MKQLNRIHWNWRLKIKLVTSWRLCIAKTSTCTWQRPSRTIGATAKDPKMSWKIPKASWKGQSHPKQPQQVTDSIEQIFEETWTLGGFLRFRCGRCRSGDHRRRVSIEESAAGCGGRGRAAGSAPSMDGSVTKRSLTFLVSQLGGLSHFTSSCPHHRYRWLNQLVIDFQKVHDERRFLGSISFNHFPFRSQESNQIGVFHLVISKCLHLDWMSNHSLDHWSSITKLNDWNEQN